MNKIPIHGRVYDLTGFNHPGGSHILELCKGEPDCSALFESYHIFGDMDKIKSIMNKYVVGPTSDPSMFSFEERGFYKTLKNRVVSHFEGKSTKWSLDHLYTIGSSLLLFSLSQYTLFSSSSILLKSVSSILSGFSMMSLYYNVLHDCSHNALSENITLNKLLTTSITCPVFLNYKLWMYHHVIRHHQYTGLIEFDPDLHNLEPYIRKSHKIKRYDRELSRHNLVYKYLLFNVFAPGILSGQMRQYVLWIIYKRLWKMTLPDSIGSSGDIIQYVLSVTYVSMYIYHAGFMYLYLYILGLNILYLIGTAPDHDMYETHQQIEGHKEGTDWGEMQVRHSGNFMSEYSLFTRYMGGINYQIEHHLFPSISNHRLKDISPIVKQCCTEFSIPYVCIENPMDVFDQVINTYIDVHLKED